MSSINGGSSSIAEESWINESIHESISASMSLIHTSSRGGASKQQRRIRGVRLDHSSSKLQSTIQEEDYIKEDESIFDEVNGISQS